MSHRIDLNMIIFVSDNHINKTVVELLVIGVFSYHIVMVE